MFITAVALFSEIFGLYMIGSGVRQNDKIRLAFGCLLALITAPAFYFGQNLGAAAAGQVCLAVLGIIFGVAVIWGMIHLFATTSPFSENATEFILFGFCKWDNFANFLIIGLVVLGISCFSLSNSLRTGLEYQQAYESIDKCAREKTHQPARSAPKPHIKTAQNKRHEAKSEHHNRKLASR